MRGYKPLYLSVLLLAFLIFYCVSGVSAQQERQPVKRILVVHSYHEGQKNHVGRMKRGVDDILNKSGFQVKHFYMDTKRDSSRSWMEISGKLALELARLWKPDLVIALDDNAQKYFARFLAEKEGAPIVVFSGVNADPAIYGFPAENVTGVLERPNIEESISLLMKICPNKIKRMLFISDKSATTDPFFSYLKTLTLPVTIVAEKQPLTFAAWKQVIDEYKDDVDAIGIYVSRTVKKAPDANETVPETELIDYINKTTNLPTVGFFDSAAKAGILCAVSVSMEEQGRQAALIALDLLRKNKEIKDIKILPSRHGSIQLNLKVAEEKNIIIPYSTIKKAKVLIK